MAFINWGNESEKQKKFRKFLEEQALLEQAVNSSQGRSGNAPGVGGGSLLYKSQVSPTNQTSLVVFWELNQPNYRYYMANYDTGNITGPFDTGVSAEDYPLSDLNRHTILYGGYGLRFYRNDINEHTMLFVNHEGMIVDNVVAISVDVAMNDYEGRFIVATDYDEQLIWIFDGTSVLTDTSILTGADSFNIGTSEDSAIPSGVGIWTAKTVGGGSDILREFYLCTGVAVNKIYEHTQTPENEETIDFYFYSDIDKLIVFTRNAGNSRIRKIEIVSTSGAIDHTYSIDDTVYTDLVNLEFFGDKCFFLHLYNSGDNTVDHLVYRYDGTVNNFFVSTYDAQKYTNWITVSRFRGNNTSYLYDAVNNAAIVFWGNEIGTTNGFVESEDILIHKMFAGTSNSSYLYADGEAKKIYTSDIGLSKNYLVFAIDSANLNLMSSLVVKSTASPLITSLGHSISNLDDIDLTETGDRVVLVVEYDEEIPVNTIIHSFNSSGTKASGVLELATASHSTRTAYGTYVVDGDDGYDTFLSSTGNWVQYPRLNSSANANFHVNSERTDAPHLFTWGESIIPYTHTQMAVDPDGGSAPEDFIMDGVDTAGTEYFGSGSSYFTNHYPGLFTMVAKSINISSFWIDGNIGADGNGLVDTDVVSIPGYSKNYTAYVKKVYDTSDPSINHIIIIDTDGTGVSHSFDSSSEDDFHKISGISSATELHYLLFATAEGSLVSSGEIEQVITEYLDLVDGQNISTTLSTLNSNYSNVTGVFPAYDSGVSGRIYYFSDRTSGDLNQITDGGDDMYDTANRLYTSLSEGIQTRIFKANGSVSTFNVADYNAYWLGRNGFFHSSEHPETGNVVIRQYDLNGNLIATANTPHPDYTNGDYVENRGMLITEEKIFDPIEAVIYRNTRLHVMSKNGISYVELNLVDADNQRIVHNDWGWLND